MPAIGHRQQHGALRLRCSDHLPGFRPDRIGSSQRATPPGIGATAPVHNESQKSSRRVESTMNMK
jgi:hypothetical protein